ncbi:hypothetical protein L6R50_05210, partial [Myxococcota bacterium]|nr:hypothetical protein [Myxococcota bacterium]
MTPRSIALPLSILFVLLAPRPSSAMYHPLRVCVWNALNYDDASPGVGDDFWTDNADTAAGGIWVKVTSQGSTLFDNYTEEHGGAGQAGCTPLLPFVTGAYFNVYVYSESQVDGHKVKVYRDETNVRSVQTFMGLLTTDYPINTSVAVTTSATHSFLLLAASTFALFTVQPDLATTYTLRAVPHSACGTCVVGGEAWFDPFYIRKKYAVSRQLGLMTLRSANGGNSAIKSYTSRLVNLYNDRVREDGVDTNRWASELDHGWHELNTREYQSTAAIEGFANYFAAVAWNEPDPQDCWFEQYNPLLIDWDLSGSVDGAESDRSVDCASYATAPLAYMDTLCNKGAWVTGSNDYIRLVNRGTEIDWMRFLWNLMVQESLTFAQ